LECNRRQPPVGLAAKDVHYASRLIGGVTAKYSPCIDVEPGFQDIDDVHRYRCAITEMQCS
jgi:hypothetical protein